ncbi:hypothetical protein L2E82_13856 [Cichorium intybus]|uniref:Uncharacterized protein n=1 Tax=Cichorium intybus TaxID=13427 RepID=A0ACB9EZ02_CICIN|nr:hypothetical protein L2E82_13856 [Cichorium intybus]
METNGIHSSRLGMLIMVACVATSSTYESDTSCLTSIKESLEDPFGIFSSRDFNDKHEGFICGFAGVQCWQNLSSSDLSGLIPSDFGDGLGFIVDLNLSNNNLSGPISPSIVNWRYINFLRLDNNNLTGQLPPDLCFFGVEREERGREGFVNTDGPRGLYRGFDISIMTCTPSNAVWWALYSVAQKLVWGGIESYMCKKDDDSSENGGVVAFTPDSRTIMAVQGVSVAMACSVSALVTGAHIFG